MAQAQRRQREVKPRNYASENKRPTISFRVRTDVVEKLKAGAAANDLSLSEEVERCVNFKFNFARDAHDELFMRSIKTAFEMAEEVAGARWFESEAAAKLCHAAVVNAANLLVLGLGPDSGPNFTEVVDSTGVAVASMAVNKTAGFGMTEARQRYDAAVASYRHFDRQNYILVKTLSETGEPLEWATRALTDEELAIVQSSDGAAPEVEPPAADPAPSAQADAPPEVARKRRGRPRKAG